MVVIGAQWFVRRSTRVSVGDAVRLAAACHY
jgi:hypothetical protein